MLEILSIERRHVNYIKKTKIVKNLNKKIVDFEAIILELGNDFEADFSGDNR